MSFANHAISFGKWKNGSGAWLTRALFYETSINPESTLYTLKEEDHLGFKSLKQLYLQVGDYTEYEFAKKYLGGVKHWEVLLEAPWFKEHIEEWRRELSLRMQSHALSRIMDEAKKDTPTKFTANKYLLERGWLPKSDPGASKRGRPSKADIQNAVQDIVEDEQRLRDDMARINARETIQ